MLDGLNYLVRTAHPSRSSPQATIQLPPTRTGIRIHAGFNWTTKAAARAMSTKVEKDQAKQHRSRRETQSQTSPVVISVI